MVNFFSIIISFLQNRTHRNLIVATLLTIGGGTVTYHFTEGWNWLDSVYFSIITLTTVGYGDFSPQTNFGKIFTIFYIMGGIGLMFGFLDAIYDHRIGKRKEYLEKRRQRE